MKKIVISEIGLSRREKWVSYKRVDRATNHVHEVLKGSTLNEKVNVIKKASLLDECDMQDEIFFSTSDSIFESKICAGFLRYLKELQYKKNFKTFFHILVNHFGEGMECEEFMFWLSKKIGTKKNILVSKYHSWVSSDFC